MSIQHLSGILWNYTQFYILKVNNSLWIDNGESTPLYSSIPLFGGDHFEKFWYLLTQKGFLLRVPNIPLEIKSEGNKAKGCSLYTRI